MPEPASTTLLATVNYPTGSTTATRGKYLGVNSMWLDITPKTTKNITTGAYYRV
jgi:hypothetical protein